MKTAWEKIERVIRTLGDKEAYVLRRYYGPHKTTLKEIAEELAISGSRAFQIKERGLHRMRHISRSRVFRHDPGVQDLEIMKAIMRERQP